MRTKYFKLAILAVVLSSLLIGTSMAQPSGKRGPHPEMGERFLERIPDITEKQKEQIKDLRTDHMKEVLPLQNQVQEKQAHLKTISTGENVNMDKINSTIEEIGALKMNMAKKRATHRQEIRNILTEDQRVVFDSMPMNKGMHQKCESRPDHHRMRPGNKF